jgi:hypothetical protein
VVGLNLLEKARRAGLALWGEAGRLVVRGQRRHEGLARLLLDHKAEVLAELDATTFRVGTLEDLFSDSRTPTWSCFTCDSNKWWRLKPGGRVFAGGPWICGVCHPPLPPAPEVEWAGGEV